MKYTPIPLYKICFSECKRDVHDYYAGLFFSRWPWGPISNSYAVLNMDCTAIARIKAMLKSRLLFLFAKFHFMKNWCVDIQSLRQWIRKIDNGTSNRSAYDPTVYHHRLFNQQDICHDNRAIDPTQPSSVLQYNAAPVAPSTNMD